LLLLWANLGADWTELRSNGRTLLHVAAESRRRSSSKSSNSSKSSCSSSALQGLLAFIASREGIGNIVNEVDDHGKTALHLCAASGVGVRLVVRLHGVDVDKPDRYGRSALIVAAEEEHVGAVMMLLRSGADINFFAQYRPVSYCTALACAVFTRNHSMTQLLLLTPGIIADQPLLLGLPDAPTARTLAKTESLRSLFEAHELAQAASVRNVLGEAECLRSMEAPEGAYFLKDSTHSPRVGGRGFASSEAAGKALAQQLIKWATRSSHQSSCFTGLVAQLRSGKV